MPRPMTKYKADKPARIKPGFYPMHENSEVMCWWEQGKYWPMIKQYANKTQAEAKAAKITEETGISCERSMDYPFIIIAT